MRANLKSISHTRHLLEIAFAWELTKETIHLHLGCLQGGMQRTVLAPWAFEFTFPGGLKSTFLPSQGYLRPFPAYSSSVLAAGTPFLSSFGENYKRFPENIVKMTVE